MPEVKFEKADTRSRASEKSARVYMPPERRRWHRFMLGLLVTISLVLLVAGSPLTRATVRAVNIEQPRHASPPPTPPTPSPSPEAHILSRIFGRQPETSQPEESGSARVVRA